MKILFILLASCIISTSTCFSQTQWPAVYDIKSDTAYWQDITSNCWMLLEDKAGKWKLNDVLTLHKAGKFHHTSTGFDTTAHTYWVVYQLSNNMNKDARISLNSFSDFDEFNVKSDSNDWKHFISGKFNDWKQKDGLKFADCIPVTMLPGEKLTIYQRMSNKKPGLPHDFQVAILNTDKIIQEYYIDAAEKRQTYFSPANLQEAFIIGMIFLAAFMNFFFYRIVKEKVYLYFALFAFFIGVNRLFGISYNYFLVFDRQKLDYVNHLGYAWLFISFFLVQFFRHFLGNQKRWPRLDKWFLWLIIVFLAISLLRIVLRVFQISGIQWFRFVSSPFIFIFIPVGLLLFQFFSLKQSGKANRFVLFGSLPLLSLYIIGQFLTPDGLNLNPTHPVARFFAANFRLIEAVCLAILLVTFTWVLLMRFIHLRKENAQQALERERLAKEIEIERNELIAAQKIQLEKDVAIRTAELKQSLEELKATQSQLIQSEKMASLGELTAGIAHEIQNPLNFVNNFSEVSAELMDEMNEELNKGGIDEAKVIADDIKQNLEKINHHGKRADAIVKGMLQHSRSGSGKKEATDINKLADEYLRLAYHGLRAKDKSFNATMKTDFDESIDMINVVSQDIGRVILNLLTNAFYAVHEKAGSTVDYTPTVSVSTKKINDQAAITIADNGNGIPQQIIDKIFQPFFTTKPTGKGTGLGLSLAYDIVKAHGGALKVETKEGEGSTFQINLPMTNS